MTLRQQEALTGAQEDALIVLREDGGRVPAGKNRSRLDPVHRVNTRAADALVAKGLARRHTGRFDAFAATDEYSLTPDGRALADRLGPAVLRGIPR